jgi:hypothetical protein
MPAPMTWNESALLTYCSEEHIRAYKAAAHRPPHPPRPFFPPRVYVANTSPNYHPQYTSPLLVHQQHPATASEPLRAKEQTQQTPRCYKAHQPAAAAVQLADPTPFAVGEAVICPPACISAHSQPANSKTWKVENPSDVAGL